MIAAKTATPSALTFLAFSVAFEMMEECSGKNVDSVSVEFLCWGTRVAFLLSFRQRLLTVSIVPSGASRGRLSGVDSHVDCHSRARVHRLLFFAV